MRDALAALLDQRTPFGRLALAHVVATAGDTIVTISLAGSLFFTVSLGAARGRVILYLLLTMAPFAVVAPLLGPVIDRSRGARRAVVVASMVGRAAMCLFMARDLGNLLLFPEAFTMLVLSKVYLVTKGALVPLVVAASSAGRQGDATAAGPGPNGAAVERVPRSVQVGTDDPNGDELATANARLGLLASLAGFAAALPAIGVLKVLGAPWVLRLGVVVFLAGAVLGLRLPVWRGSGGDWAQSRRHPAVADEGRGSGQGTADDGWEREGLVRALGPRFNTHPEVVLALSAMSVVKALVGFLTFMLAFSLRRMHTAKWWYGVMLAATVAGALVGVMLVPKMRRKLTEPQMLALSIWAVSLAGVLAALVGGIVIQTVLAFVIGLAGAAAKPAFDALVQRYVPAALQGRGFARFETRLQMAWVIGALVPVVANVQLGAGDIIIAAVAAVSGLSYLTSRRALRRRWPGAV
jgi:hypothetical protein